MGHWEQPSREVYRKVADALTSLSSLVLQDDLDELLAMMDKAGLIVRQDYYIPEPDELYEMYYWQRAARPGGFNYRWVMCRETVDAVARKYERQVVPRPITFDANWWKANDDTVDAAIEVDQIVESHRYGSSRDRLFGVDIRIDPAARRPMFEIVKEAKT